MLNKNHPAPAKIYFADIAVDWLEPKQTLPHKFQRLLARLNLASRVTGKHVGIKMHYGGNVGYTTVHPIFIRILVQALKDAGAASIKTMDNNPADGIPRGYTPEILGCNVVSTFGCTGKYLYRENIDYKTLDFVEYGGEAVDCDFFIDLSHIKGHGDCGFGGAVKNISMGCVLGSSRAKLHKLEGGITHEKDKCTLCLKCLHECQHKSISYNKDKKALSFFTHHCTFCQHCVMICPQGALTMNNRKYDEFAKGMAMVGDRFLRRFKPENLLFINVLTNITIFCDCWGMSSASIVPDIGILCSDDIVAIETATLDMIKTANLLPNGIPKNRKLVKKGKHLFEKIHGKDPYTIIRLLEKFYGGTHEYEVEEVK